MEPEPPESPDIGELLAADPLPGEAELRVVRILDRSRQELGLRDLVTFSLVRVWNAVPLLATALIDLLSTRSERRRR